MPAPSLEEWIELIRQFIDGSIPADEFDVAYFALHDRANTASDSGEPWIRPEEAGRIIDDFFIEVDCLSNDPESFPDISVTEDELRGTARHVVAELEQLAAGSSGRPGALRSVLQLVFVSILLVGQAVVFAGYALWRTVHWLAARILRLFRDS
jgi:hypothetical protein